MNNIPKKNVILQSEKSNGLPYGDAGCIEYVSDQNINSAVLNNTFRQLVDNDLYAENYIRNYSSVVVGPKTSAPSEVRLAPNGYKAFSDDGIKMRIYRKQDDPLSASVSCVLPSVSANFVTQLGSYVIAGCDDGIYYEQDSFKRLYDDIPAFGYWFDDGVRLVASRDGVYSLVMKAGFDITQYHLFVKLNANDIGRCNAVSYVRETGTIVVGTDDGVYEGECAAGDLQDPSDAGRVTFSRMKMTAAGRQVSSRVNGISLSSTAALAATGNGVFRPSVASDFIGFGTALDGKNIRFQLEYAGKWLIAADDGIYESELDYSGDIRRALDISQAVGAVSATSCAYIAASDDVYGYAEGKAARLGTGIDGIRGICLYCAGGREFLIVAADGGVYYITGGMSAQLVELPDAQVNGVLVRGGVLFVGTSGGVFQYELSVDPGETESLRILSFERICEFLPEDPPQRGLVSAGGRLFSYSDGGIFCVDDPGVKTGIRVDSCCSMRVGGADYIAVASGNDVRVMNQELQTLNSFSSPGAVTKMITTDGACVALLGTGTVWQASLRKMLASGQENAFSQVDVGFADDISSYKGYAAALRDGKLKFMKEQALPKKIQKLSQQVVTGIRHVEGADVVFVTTSGGMTAADMKEEGYPEQQVYEGNTHGCWSRGDELYCFTDDGVNAYSVSRNDGGISAKFVCTMLPGMIVNGMCSFGDRLLFAANGGIYASTKAERYDKIKEYGAELPFCFGFTAADGEGAFLCYDGTKFFAFRRSDGAVICQYDLTGAAVTGACMSQLRNAIYVATSSGLFAYDVVAAEIKSEIGGNFVGIGRARYDQTRTMRIFAARSTVTDSRVYAEADDGSFRTIDIASDIIDQQGQTVSGFCVISQSVQAPRLVLYVSNDALQPGETKYVAKCVEINTLGEIGRLIYSVPTDFEFDKIIPSATGSAYMAGSGKVYVFRRDEPKIEYGFESDWMHFGSDSSAYRLYGTEYQREDKDGWQTLAISTVERYRGRITCLACQDSEGYASVSSEGVVGIRADPSATVPVKTDFQNDDVATIQNAFGLILTTIDNKLYWSDVKTVEELGSSSAYNVILNREQHFTGYFAAEDEGMVYAYGTQFVCTWPATNKMSFLLNADRYDKLDIRQFEIRTAIPHQSSAVGAYLDNDPYYGRPYVFSKSGGIYVYDADNVQLTQVQSLIQNATRLFGVPDGIAYQTQTGVRYTTDCAVDQQLYADGVELGFQVQDMLHDGRAYYYLVSGKWMYSLNGNQAEVPDGVKMDAVLRSGSTVCTADGKVYRARYDRVKTISRNLVLHELRAYSVSGMYPTPDGVQYAARDGQGARAIGPDYAVRQFRLEDGTVASRFGACCFSDDGETLYFEYEGAIHRCGVAGSAAERMRTTDVAFPNAVYVRNGRTGFDTRTGLAYFDEYGVVSVYEQVDGLDIDARSLHRIGDGDYVICTPEGLYRYVQDFIYKLSYDYSAAMAFCSDSFSGKQEYSTAAGSDVVRGSDLVNWDYMFSVSADQYEVRQMHVKSLNDYYVATGQGIYKTVYSYQMINDIEQRDEYELQAVVDSLQDDLDATYEKQLAGHVGALHSDDSDITFVNGRMLSTDLAGIAADWQSVEEGAEFVVENDIVQRVQFGDVSAIGCEVAIENPLFSKQNAAADYVMKKYMSGVCELYVHIPTTYTYYLDGVPGSACPDADPDAARQRKNLTNMMDLPVSAKSQNSRPGQHATEITLTVPSASIGMADVHDVQICPVSLPLKVYAENADDPERSQLYNSVVIPSVIRSYSADGDARVFRFCCFGSDEQSVRIQFTASERSFGTVTVAFDPNGGAGSAPVQVFVIGEEQALRANRFSKPGMAFAGWSYSRLADGQANPTYSDRQRVAFSDGKYQDGDSVTLYAVWVSQEQAQAVLNGMNQFGLQSEGETVYIKSASEVEPGKTVIMYGD